MEDKNVNKQVPVGEGKEVVDSEDGEDLLLEQNATKGMCSEIFIHANTRSDGVYTKRVLRIIYDVIFNKF